MLPLAVSVGDPSGIGPELALRAWSRRNELNLPPFYLICDPALAGARAQATNLTVPLSIASPSDAVDSFATALPVVPTANPMMDCAGVPDISNVAAVIEAIDRAVADVVAEVAAAVVTLPIAKKTLYEAGFAHPGHTEYLAHLARQATDSEVTPVMMLAGPELRTVPVTVHIPLGAVSASLSKALICQTIRIVAKDLQTRFAIAAPRIAVAGLNPHAGEGGALGSEDEGVIAPAVYELQSEGYSVHGPLPADTMFHARARQSHDVAICMYHDQALIPAKALAFDETVNVTLGLPFIRTSPDHGTAFDIAGKGIAREDSFVAALRLASDLAVSEHRAPA